MKDSWKAGLDPEGDFFKNKPTEGGGAKPTAPSLRRRATRGGGRGERAGSGWPSGGAGPRGLRLSLPHSLSVSQSVSHRALLGHHLVQPLGDAYDLLLPAHGARPAAQSRPGSSDRSGRASPPQ